MFWTAVKRKVNDGTCSKFDSSLLTGGTWWEQCCISYNYEGSSKSHGLIDPPSYFGKLIKIDLQGFNKN